MTESDINYKKEPQPEAEKPSGGAPPTEPPGPDLPVVGARLWIRRLGWAALLLMTMVVLFGVSFYTTMRVVLAGREVITPSLTGMTAEEAEELLADSELYLEAIAERYDSQIEKDRITAQEPLPGAVLKRNRKIRVTLSLGPLEVPVPDVRGQTLRSAELALRQDGLDVGHVAYTHVRGVAPDVVVAQHPLPEQVRDEGSSNPEIEGDLAEGRVALLVSRGAREDVFIMPDLKGRTLEEVEALAARTGFRIGAVRKQRIRGDERDRVVRQYPQAGYPVARRDIISLVLSE